MSNLNGVIPVLKPPGMTSSDVVTFIKRTLNMKKVGHSGTLDPGASGVLCVCVGRATKISDYLMNSDKEYIARFEAGTSTDTLDSYGKKKEYSECVISSSEFSSAKNDFLGNTEQIPPAYSAVKINGNPLYKYARKNIIPDQSKIKKRNIYVSSIDLINLTEKSFEIKIKCSKGTYIRTLCCDIAEKCGCIGYVSFLLRTQASGFDIKQCYTLEEIRYMSENNSYEFVTPIGNALTKMNRVNLDSYLFRIITTGSPINLEKISNPDDFADKDNLVYCKGELIGIGHTEDNFFKLDTMLYQEGIRL